MHLTSYVTSIQRQDDGDINTMSNSGVMTLHDAAGYVSGQDDGYINTEGNSGVTPLHDAA